MLEGLDGVPPHQRIAASASLSGAAVLGVIVGALLHGRANSARGVGHPERRRVLVAVGVIGGLVLSRVLPSPRFVGTVLAVLGGFICALAFFSPKLRDPAR